MQTDNLVRGTRLLKHLDFYKKSHLLSHKGMPLQRRDYVIMIWGK